MVKLYVKNIMVGKYSYDRVPAIYKDRVKAAFDEKLEKNEITQEEYNRYLGITDVTDTEE